MSVTPIQAYRFTMTSLPPIGRSKIHNNFRKPPRLPVILNKRTLYMPYTMMYDDNLVELKRMKHSELTDKTRRRNKMEMDCCCRNINLSYRDHLYAMGSIRQEQSLVYHLMCKVQRDKRKIQRQTHRRHEEEFQEKMRWQRIKSMCHYVVFKFRENAKRKKEERLETDVDASNKQHSSTNQTSSSKPKFKSHLQIIPGQDDYNENPKYVDITDAIESGIREHIDTVEDNVLTDNFKGTANTKEKTLYSRAKSEVDLAFSETIVVSKDYRQYTGNQSEVPDFGISQNVHEKKISQRECSEIAISERSFLESKNNGCTSIEINNMKYKQSTEIRPKIKVIEVSKNRPSKHLTRDLQTSDISIDTSSKEGSPVGTGIQEILHTEKTMNNPVKNNVNNVSLAEHNASVYPVKTRRTGVVCPPASFLTSDQQRIKTTTRDLTVTQHEQICQAANQKHKQERESLVHVIKKRARIRAKRDLDRLNNESFVKYEKTKNGLIEAYPGKRETFIPPTTKIIYNRHKLLRQERESIFLQSVKLKNFYENVVELLERPVCHHRPDAEVKERKEEMELPALQQTSSVQLTSSIFNVAQPEQIQLKEDESSRYVRVNERDLKKDVYFNKIGRRMSSWKTY